LPKTLKTDLRSIFSISNKEQFKDLALEIFSFQAENNPVYKNYLNALNIKIKNIDTIDKIPFLPIEFFKTHEINTKTEITNTKVFSSSGTTRAIQSKHIVNDISIYEKSYKTAFKQFYGNIDEYCILALLPSYLERDGSSLIYMVDDLIKQSNHPKSNFYLYNQDELIDTLIGLNKSNQKTILLGVTYALLDLAKKTSSLKLDKKDFKNIIVMETGGMKGKRKEMVKQEIHAILKSAFNIESVHSEYGMTELLSQAYSKGNGIFFAPPWMEIIIRDINDPFTFLPANKSGGINIIDLANVNSCSFIATQDLGKKHANNSFEVLGRFDNSDIRGCNLLVE